MSRWRALWRLQVDRDPPTLVSLGGPNGDGEHTDPAYWQLVQMGATVAAVLGNLLAEWAVRPAAADGAPAQLRLRLAWWTWLAWGRLHVAASRRAQAVVQAALDADLVPGPVYLRLLWPWEDTP